MDDKPSLAHYITLIDQAESYHDLAVFRARYFGLLERTFPQNEYLAIKDHWNARAKSDNLPVAPPKG